MTNNPTPIPFYEPFANGDSSATDIPDSSSSEVNFNSGFTSNFAGTTVVGRHDFNGLGKVSTEEHIFHQCGGFHTYVSGQSYPRGAVLYWMDSASPQKLHRCLSMVSNNTTQITTSVLASGTVWKDISNLSPIVMMSLKGSKNIISNNTFTAPYPCFVSGTFSSSIATSGGTSTYGIWAVIRPQGGSSVTVIEFSKEVSKVTFSYSSISPIYLDTGYTQDFRTILSTGDMLSCYRGTFSGTYQKL